MMDNLYSTYWIESHDVVFSLIHDWSVALKNPFSRGGGGGGGKAVNVGEDTITFGVNIFLLYIDRPM